MKDRMMHIKNDPNSYKRREIKASAWCAQDERRDLNFRKRLLNIKMTRAVNITIKQAQKK